MTNTKYTTLEQSQRLKKIGFEASACDGYYFYWGKDLYFNEIYNGKVTRDVVLVEDEKLSNAAADAFNYFLKSIGFKERQYMIDSFVQGTIKNCYPTYRLDTLLLALPEWCFEANGFDDEKVYFQARLHEMQIDISPLMRQVCFKPGPEAIAAAVDLICLLKEVEDNA